MSLSAASLESEDYEPFADLDAIFPDSSTFSSLPNVLDSLYTYRDALDRQISAATAAQAKSDAESAERIQQVKEEMEQLFTNVNGVRTRAMETEEDITAMTADIKRLDNAKSNLTLSMTALKRLQMLTTAVEQLQEYGKTRQYRDCAQLLQAVIQLMAHFKSYRSIDQIAILSRNIAEMQRQLLEQVCNDFELAFARADLVHQSEKLQEACLVIDALGDHARSRIVMWYCNTQLRDYRRIFRADDEAGSLDNISARYTWFGRLLRTYEQEHASIFSPHWRVGEVLASVFCDGTREDFKTILQQAARRADSQSIDVDLLLSCLQQTLDFEQELDRRLSGKHRASADTATSAEMPSPIGKAISGAFEPYMGLWIEEQERQLRLSIATYRISPLLKPEDEFSSKSVASSSKDLFQVYRIVLAQCTKLSTASRLLDLTRMFARYLDQYAQQVLFFHLSEKAKPQLASNEDIVVIINTADYCYTTCNQLEEKIKGQIDEELRSQVDLQNQADAFLGVAAAAIRVFVRKVDNHTEPAWREMRNNRWSRLGGVTDQSPYVSELLRRVQEMCREILTGLQKQQYARTFCDNTVESLSQTFISSITQCKPISEIGAEQLLLDSYVIKDSLKRLLLLNSDNESQAPASFVKRVNQAMSRVDPLLKTLQVRASPPEALVQAYLIHIADTSESNFRKILEIRGVKKAEQNQLAELFTAHRSSPAHAHLPANSALMTSVLSNSSRVAGGGGGGGGGGSTAAQLNRFDPTIFGSALFNAAKDGVDRLGTPSAGSQQQQRPPTSSSSLGPAAGPNEAGAHTPPSATQPGATTATAATTAAANLNDNLKTFGRFFKRDLSQFGSFGRKAESGGSGA